MQLSSDAICLQNLVYAFVAESGKDIEYQYRRNNRKKITVNLYEKLLCITMKKRRDHHAQLFLCQ